MLVAKRTSARVFQRVRGTETSGYFKVVILGGGGMAVCDYSLNAIRQRLACEGDELVTYRFETGSIGFASVCEVQQVMAQRAPAMGLMRRFVDWLRLGDECNVTAVCMPPGARIELRIESPEVQSTLGVPRRSEAEFDEISVESFLYRDALRLPDGRMLMLQSFPEGVQARVTALGPSGGIEDVAVLLEREDERTSMLARR